MGLREHCSLYRKWLLNHGGSGLVNGKYLQPWEDNCMEQSLRKQQFFTSSTNWQPLVPVPSQKNSIHTLPFCLRSTLISSPPPTHVQNLSKLKLTTFTPPSSAGIKNGWSYISTPKCIHGVYTYIVKFTLTPILITLTYLQNMNKLELVILPCRLCDTHPNVNLPPRKGRRLEPWKWDRYVSQKRQYLPYAA
jgi:hypothetical protein